jgi:hypothetical protein
VSHTGKKQKPVTEEEHQANIHELEQILRDQKQQLDDALVIIKDLTEVVEHLKKQTLHGGIPQVGKKAKFKTFNKILADHRKSLKGRPK